MRGRAGAFGERGAQTTSAAFLRVETDTMVKTLATKDVYRPDEVAAALDVSVRSVYRWMAKGHIQHIHCGSKIRVHREEMDRILRVGIGSHCSIPDTQRGPTCSRCGDHGLRGDHAVRT